jgi:hypothetical protein
MVRESGAATAMSLQQLETSPFEPQGTSVNCRNWIRCAGQSPERAVEVRQCSTQRCQMGDGAMALVGANNPGATDVASP